MKLLFNALLLSCLLPSIQAQEISKKPDFIQKNEKGEVTLRGVYTTDDSGYVIRYDIYDAGGSLIETHVPYYSKDGRIIQGRQYDANGKLTEVVVFLGDRMVGLSPDGKRLDKYDDTKVDMEGFLRHFRPEK